jgi:predicted lipoprotein with Yx(FWY)xxD motif
MRHVMAVLAVGAGLSLAIAGTGFAAGAATVQARHGKLGTFLVDAKGRTLYLFEKDKTKKSTCSGSCAVAWPPLLTTGKPKAGGTTKASLLGTSRRSDGKTQVTYKGHPLYYFVMDKKAGDTKGQGLNAFGAKWYVLAPSGGKIDKS